MLCLKCGSRVETLHVVKINAGKTKTCEACKTKINTKKCHTCKNFLSCEVKLFEGSGCRHEKNPKCT